MISRQKIWELSDDDIHLWYSSLDLPATSLNGLETTLDEDEQKRANRFCFERERARFVACHGLLRRILGHYVDSDPSELRFSYNPNGKPSLRERFGGDRIQFSLSHSSGCAIYAVTLNRKIGVDLERIAPIPELEQIVNHFFSDQEKSVFHLLADNEKQTAFFKTWAAKEAYVKACGEGLTHLNRIAISLEPSKFKCSLKNGSEIWENSHWWLEQLRPASNFIAAVVAERSDLNEAIICRPNRTSNGHWSKHP
ncbi:MAG TPA: 4'-phosphopantetheinyl transferase superfamily protein [Candidatus Bathyarchaeia archaeon]|nr:4'-phosphopantetheinyl transferase superfamily protein [Candidatus Bathyarchaeia archaeon]